MDFSIYVNSRYAATASGKDEQDFRLYFDFKHLKESASMIYQSQFLGRLGEVYKKDCLKNHYTEDIKVTPDETSWCEWHIRYEEVRKCWAR